MALVKFIRGTKSSYNALSSKNSDAIYFLSDTQEIIMNGTSYGTSSSLQSLINQSVKSADYDATTGTLTLTTNGGSTTSVTLLTAGNGISIASNAISAKVDSASESYLTVSASGLKVSGIDDAIAAAKSEAVSSASTATTTAINNLDVSDSAVATKFVTAVSETNGKISVSRGAVTSTDKTVTVSSASDGGINLAVNVDGTTITKDSSTGKLSVVSSALEAYTGEDAIDVSSGKVVSLTINSGDQILSQSESGLLANLSLQYTAKTSTSNAKIDLIGKDSTVISTIDASDFIKDGMLDSAALREDGDNTYLDLTFNTDSGKDTVSVDVTSLVDIYTAGNGITVTDNVIAAKVDSSSESFLTVGSGGIKLSGVQTAINTAATKAKTTVSAGTNIAVTSSTNSDGSTNYTVAASGLATTTALNNEISRAEAAEDAIEAAVGLNADGTHKTTTGNYTSSATTIAEEIAALDSQVKANADAIAVAVSGGITGVKVNGVNASISGNTATVTIDGGDIALTGYTAATSASAVTATDTVNSAVAKLAYQLTWEEL